jgi:NitT/TauT family transport system ATP-binding protein
VEPSTTVDHQAPAKARPAREPGGTVAVELDRVSLEFPRRDADPLPVLDGVSLSVTRDERVALIGPSGCGKSTILNVVAGLAAPHSGRTLVEGEVALMPQRDLLVPWRRALDNAALALEAEGVSRAEARERAHPLFERFGLAQFEQAWPHELSGGMRQRVAFLRTIITGRPVIALDEPFGALDSLTRSQMQDWLGQALATEPRTLLLVTHDVEEALVLADRVIVLGPRPAHVVTEIPAGDHASVERTDWVTSREFADTKRRVLEALR